MLNLMTVKVGEYVRLKDGTVAQVTDNIGDGIWLELLSADSGEGELVHCEEMVEVTSAPAA